MANRQGIKFIIGRPKEKAKAKVTQVQSVIFHRQKWKPAGAKAWLKKHGFRYGTMDQTKAYYRFRQKDPALFQRSWYSVIIPGEKKNPTGVRYAIRTKKGKKTVWRGQTWAAASSMLDPRWGELSKKQHEIVRLSDGKVINPVRTNGKAGSIRQATQRYKDFHGDEPGSIDRMRIRQTPKVLYTLGELISVTYAASRDGRRHAFVHKFKKESRPLLTVTKDGKQLYLLGGAYSVTDRGIEDKAR